MSKRLIVRKYRLECTKKIGHAHVKIAFLSDMHNRTEGEQGEKIFNILREYEPDMVLVGGDVMIGKPGCDIQPAIRFMRKLSDQFPVWYANGNHEQRITGYPGVYGKMGNQYDEALKQTKAVRLINRQADVEIKGIPITIFGFEQPESYYRKFVKKRGTGEELTRMFGTPLERRYSILLSHSPRYKKEYLRWGADLTLSGHYHGGVMMLGKKMGLVTPDYRIFSNVCGGMSRLKNAVMIVSAGVGEHTLPLRIHNPREVTLIQVDFS